jgi:hypothetical protein
MDLTPEPDLRLHREVKPSPGQSLLLAGYPREALLFLERDNSPGGLINQGIALRWLDQLDDAKDRAERAIQAAPGMAEGWNLMGMLAEDSGWTVDALNCYQQAWARMETLAGLDAPGCKHVALNLAMALMRLERFEEAWPLWEYGRLGEAWWPLPGKRIWQGEPGRVLVMSEGGFGDAFLFSRWLFREPLLAWATLCVWDGLADFGLMPGQVIPQSQPIDPERFDCSTSLLSLMAVVGMHSLADIPPAQEFHCAPYQHVGQWGICWDAEETGTRRRHRSVPIQALEPLSRWHWTSLCPGRETPDWIRPLKLRTWQDTAQAIAGLDLVVTVDTAVAHLAGLLGKRTIVLLSTRSDWKYFRAESVGDTCPWWPSVRLIRNMHPTDWSGAVARLAARLESL